MIQKYKIINQYSEEYSFDAIPLNWDHIPESVSDKIPGEYLSNVYALTGEGGIIEKTVVFLDPIKKLSDEIENFKLGENIIIQLPDD